MSPLDSTSPSSSSSAGTTTCHALPCNIDYTGRAPVDAYFRPAPILPSGDNDHDEASSRRPQYQAATFRGRGLLARCPDSTAGEQIKKFQGVVLSKNHNNDGQEQLQTVQTFDSFIEWHHEHFTSAVDQKPSRLSTAVDWLETASALHAPIPVPKKSSNAS